jgi:ribonuclease J
MTTSSIRLFALGGLGEIGMNCFALEQRGEVLIIDCGVTFDARVFGIDVVHPDFSALDSLHVVGIAVTHGHEDHIGAIPYFLRRFDVPVFAPAYALALLRERASEHDILAHASLREIAPRQRVQIGSFDIEPIRVTHSIADATALAIWTDAGLVIHTGDFKFDDMPPDGETFDLERFEELAREGVRLLLSDSTNIDSEGHAGSEQKVGHALDAIVGAAPNAVVVGLFASNVHRLKLLGDIASRHGRKLVALGRSMGTHMRVARAVERSTGPHAGAPYLEWRSDLVWPTDRARELPRREVLALATGTQGEEPAALSRLSRCEFPAFDVAPGDTVVLSSRVIPGSERDVLRMTSDFLRRGVKVRSWWSDHDAHVSGHAQRADQERMLDLVRPRSFVPVHGTLHQLIRHAELARDKGIADTLVLENGDRAELDGDSVCKAGRVSAGRVHIFAGRPVSDRVLRDRGHLAAHGIAYAIIPIDGRGRPVGMVSLDAKGVVDEVDGARVIELARQEASHAAAALRESMSDRIIEESVLTDTVRLAVRGSFFRSLGFKPVTIAITVRVVR